MRSELQEHRRARLRAAVEREGGNAAFGRLMGWASGDYVRQMLVGDRPITEKFIDRVERLPRYRGWFSRSGDDKGQARKFTAPAAEAPPEVNDVELSQYRASGPTGSGIVLRDQPGVIHSWRVSADWIRKNIRGYSEARKLCIVTGFGDSMKPMFNPGDPLLVDTAIRTVDFDAVYFFRVGEEGFIKRLQRIPGEGLRVLSANRNSYDPWTIKPEMDFEVLGRVVKVWCSDDL
ncbi:MAG: S24 family peptidase [Burkholderiaceae bacterium]